MSILKEIDLVLMIDNLSVHDGVLCSLKVDQQKSEVTLKFLAYVDLVHASKRTLFQLAFSNVIHISHITELNVLDKHASAGHIVDWIWQQELVYKKVDFFLCGGVISITAKKIDMWCIED